MGLYLCVFASRQTDEEVAGVEVGGYDDFPAFRTAVADRLESSERPVDVLVNNAGYGLHVKLLDDKPDEHRRAIDAMCLAVLALGGAALCLVLAVPVGLLVVRYKGRLAIWAERLPYLLHALPGLVIALALVYFSLHYVPALYQTSALLLIA